MLLFGFIDFCFEAMYANVGVNFSFGKELSIEFRPLLDQDQVRVFVGSLLETAFHSGL